MSLPLWDPIELPPDHTLIDINSIEPEPLRLQLQARALELFAEVTGEDPTIDPRAWSDEEGCFAIYVGAEIVGVSLVFGVESV